MVLVLSFGILTLTIFLPVLLSIIGPHWNAHKELNKENKAFKEQNDGIENATELTKFN